MSSEHETGIDTKVQIRFLNSAILSYLHSDGCASVYTFACAFYHHFCLCYVYLIRVSYCVKDNPSLKPFVCLFSWDGVCTVSQELSAACFDTHWSCLHVMLKYIDSIRMIRLHWCCWHQNTELEPANWWEKQFAIFPLFKWFPCEVMFHLYVATANASSCFTTWCNWTQQCTSDNWVISYILEIDCSIHMNVWIQSHTHTHTRTYTHTHHWDYCSGKSLSLHISVTVVL